MYRRRSESICMSSKEVVKRIRHIFNKYYFLREDCTIDSLVRIERRLFSCEGCVLLDTEKVICPRNRELRILK